jgi:hypothetical protein
MKASAREIALNLSPETRGYLRRGRTIRGAFCNVSEKYGEAFRTPHLAQATVLKPAQQTVTL